MRGIPPTGFWVFVNQHTGHSGGISRRRVYGCCVIGDTQQVITTNNVMLPIFLILCIVATIRTRQEIQYLFHAGF